MPRRRGVALAIGLVVALAAAGAAEAVPYRLQVVSLFEGAFASFLSPGELVDGASGPGLDRLDASLDQGLFPPGGTVYDRRLHVALEAKARAYGGVPVWQNVTYGPAYFHLWQEVRWEGQPGQQSVWSILPDSRWWPEVARVAIKGPGPLRQYLPYPIPMFNGLLPVIRMSENYLWLQEERGTLWSRYLSRSLDLTNGLGLVVARPDDPLSADRVTVVIRQAEQPTTYKVILAWRDRPIDIERRKDEFKKR
jgi:hypothetical protein